jgi:hypothetical protein
VIETNPASTIVLLLKAVRDKSTAPGRGGGFGGGGFVMGTFREAMDLQGAGGFSIIDGLVAIRQTLDWLAAQSETMAPKKREKYANGCKEVKRRLDWEFGDRSAAPTEPIINVEGLISEFEIFAIDLEDHGHYEPLDDQELQNWEDAVSALIIEVNDSGLAREARTLLLDALVVVRSGIRNIRNYGSVAGAERLKDALGRLAAAEITLKDADPTTRDLLVKAWTTFAKVVGFVETVGKLKALPDLLSSVKALGM